MAKSRPKIHQGFVTELKKLEGKRLESTNCGIVSSDNDNEDFIVIELLIGDKRLCAEIAVSPAKGGRYFILNKDQVDGAGVFPLPISKKEVLYDSKGT